jgi:3-oxoacyl-[acyl-carrier protein] reductase
MNLGIEGAVAFVAGASGGLGRAVARELLREGASVAICSRSEKRINEAAQLLRTDIDDPQRVLPVVCDVTDEAHIEAAMNKTISAFGSLNILVTNAGGPATGMIDDHAASDWRNALELNLMSTINLCRYALVHLRDAAALKDGLARILMISSLAAKQPVAGLYLSNVSRAGVQGFAKSLSEEVGVDGITVNTILPGYTKTDRLTHLSESLNEQTGRSIESIEADWSKNSALKRIGTEDEFSAAAAFLVSRRASFITGISLTVDGGAVKGLF